jgi:hypothetical protein
MIYILFCKIPVFRALVVARDTYFKWTFFWPDKIYLDCLILP